MHACKVVSIVQAVQQFVIVEGSIAHVETGGHVLAIEAEILIEATIAHRQFGGIDAATVLLRKAVSKVLRRVEIEAAGRVSEVVGLGFNVGHIDRTTSHVPGKCEMR